MFHAVIDARIRVDENNVTSKTVALSPTIRSRESLSIEAVNSNKVIRIIEKMLEFKSFAFETNEAVMNPTKTPTAVINPFKYDDVTSLLKSIWLATTMIKGKKVRIRTKITNR